MTRLDWAKIPHAFETGLDRGVLYPKNQNLPAVPWNGLLSIDEDGQDEAATYFVDGRPFLFLPKPKEYSATLKAYTYPDEFSALMGLEEVADGMYLDSQQADSFDLCYRTLVGSSEGANAGYKLHLVYNVTATFDGASYETLADSVNPGEFSWKLNAVPVAIPGYRATAHIIIDTRHMDAERIFQVEALLYGTPAASAHMPSPTTMLDLLSFGDAIIITDNGDGTWTAEGSYANLYMIGDGIFEIPNANAVFYSGGRYAIASTGETIVPTETVVTPNGLTGSIGPTV